MKQKAVVMATTFTMLLAVGVTGIGSESLHSHPAYSEQNTLLIAEIDCLDSQHNLLPVPLQGK